MYICCILHRAIEVDKEHVVNQEDSDLAERREILDLLAMLERKDLRCDSSQLHTLCITNHYRDHLVVKESREEGALLVLM